MNREMTMVIHEVNIRYIFTDEIQEILIKSVTVVDWNIKPTVQKSALTLIFHQSVCHIISPVTVSGSANKNKLF